MTLWHAHLEIHCRGQARFYEGAKHPQTKGKAPSDEIINSVYE